MATSATSTILANSANSAAASAGVGKGLNSLKSEDFFKLLIAQLSNQDPLKPVGNQEILDQISSINAVVSNQELISTLGSLTTTQGLGAASNLIGKSVVGVVDGKTISGVVQKATIEGGQVFLKIGDKKLPISGLTEVGG